MRRILVVAVISLLGLGGSLAQADIWHIDTVGGASGYTSLVLDNSGYPHISYAGNYNVNYAHKDSSGWHTDRSLRRLQLPGIGQQRQPPHQLLQPLRVHCREVRNLERDRIKVGALHGGLCRRMELLGSGQQRRPAH